MFAVCTPLPTNGRYQDQWDYVLSNFTPDALFVIGDKKNAPKTNVFSRKMNATYIETAEELPADLPLVVLAADNGRVVTGDIDLSGFEHPENAVYLFGGDTEWLHSDQLGDREPDYCVYIDTDTHDDMWSWVTYAVVAWDRMMKNG